MTKIENVFAAPGQAPGIVGEFPCTQTQLRCWVIDQLKPGNSALNVAVRWEIRGTFKVSSIEAAFRKVIERHEILRTRFVEVDGCPMQQVVDAVNFKMSVIDLRHVPAAQREERIRAIGEETASAPFDLSQAGLFRVSLLMVRNDLGLLLITAHQTCFDGWSIRVLGREVGEIASAIDAGRIPDLPELPLQYGDYAMWQNEYLESYGFEAEKAFWKEQLGDAPYFEVAPDHPRGKTKSNRGSMVSVAKPLEFSARIDAAARKLEVSLYSHGAAVLSAMLHRYAGDRTVLFGSQIAGRDDVDLENLIGVFINNLVLRFDFDGQTSFAEHIRSTSEKVAAAINHQRMPFNKLVEFVNPVRDPSRNPLISVNFNLQKAFLEDHRYGGFELISAPSQTPGVIYDLNFLMIGRPSGWRMSVEYNADLFDKGTIEALLALWQDAYEIALKTPDAPLVALAVPARATALPTPPAAATDSALQVLLAHPSVADAAIVTEARDQVMRAFVTPTAGWTRPLEELPRILGEHLAASALAEREIPHSISVLLSIPRTEAGAPDLPKLTGTVTSPEGGSERKTAARAERTPGRSNGHDSDKTTVLGALWADVLGVDGVRRDGDFFALGGHSLLALRMLSAVRERFGVSADLAQLFGNPTLGAFARAIFGEQEEAVPAVAEPEKATGTAPAKANPWKRIVCRQGTGPCSVYTVNHPFLYYRLANELPDGVSVYNVNMFGASPDGLRTDMTLEDIAAEAIDAMALDGSTGPIALVGLCINGVLAVEMARQLRERGTDLRFTAAIDAWAPGYFKSLPKATQRRWNAERRIKRMRHFTARLLKGEMGMTTYLREFNATLRLLQLFGFKAAGLSSEEESNERVTNLLVDAARGHKAPPAGDDTVLLFRSNAYHPRAKALKFGWGEAIGQDTEVIDLDGWHENSLEGRSIKTLAAAITATLTEDHIVEK